MLACTGLASVFRLSPSLLVGSSQLVQCGSLEYSFGEQLLKQPFVRCHQTAPNMFMATYLFAAFNVLLACGTQQDGMSAALKTCLPRIVLLAMQVIAPATTACVMNTQQSTHMPGVFHDLHSGLDLWAIFQAETHCTVHTVKCTARAAASGCDTMLQAAAHVGLSAPSASQLPLLERCAAVLMALVVDASPVGCGGKLGNEETSLPWPGSGRSVMYYVQKLWNFRTA